MALFTLNEGSHYHQWPPFSTLPWIGAQSMSRTVTFNESAMYALPDYNAEDVNKLFGMSFGFGGVHHNSARFGWKWNKEAACIDLVAYVYQDGLRNQDEQLRFPVVAQVQPGQKVQCIIGLFNEGRDNEGIHLSCFVRSADGKSGGQLGSVQVPGFILSKVPSYGLTHGLFFGGSLPAPHQMNVQIDRR